MERNRGDVLCESVLVSVAVAPRDSSLKASGLLYKQLISKT